MKLVILLAFCVCLVAVHARLGGDVSTLVSRDAFKCLKTNQGFSYIIVRAYRSVCSPDPQAPTTIMNAYQEGVSADIYLFPAPHCSQSAAAQAKQTVNALSDAGIVYGTHYHKIWLDVEGTQFWRDQAFNRQFLTELANTLDSLGYSVGVYASKSQWSAILGESWVLGAKDKYELWYPHYQNTPQPNFNDFSPFGGFTKPTMKQFADGPALCGVGIDHNYRP